MNSLLFEYLYRDAANFKAFGTVVFEGSLAEPEVAVIRERFPFNGYGIAEQLGIPALYRLLYEYSNGPTQADHCWHEFRSVRLVSPGDIPADAHRGGSASDFLARVRSVKEWQEDLSPHVWIGTGKIGVPLARGG